MSAGESREQTGVSEPQAATPAPASGSAKTKGRRREPAPGMLPGRARRRMAVERGFMRLVATAGIVGIAVLLGAVLVGQDVAGWIVGLVIGLVTVLLAALLWSSRQL
jgi:hypothetical protein